MKKDETRNGVSLFGQSEYLVDGDPLEEIFALNIGDFVSEHLISEDLAKKISTSTKDKKSSLKEQLKELILIYSYQKTLRVLNFDPDKEQAIYTSIANTIKRNTLCISKKLIILAKKFSIVSNFINVPPWVWSHLKFY